MRHQRRPLYLECIHHTDDIEGLVLLRVAGIRVRRQAHAPEIRHDHRVITYQHRREWCPHVTAIAEAVQQNHGRSATAVPHIEARAVGLHHLRAKTRRVGFDCRQADNRQQRHDCEHYETTQHRTSALFSPNGDGVRYRL